MLACLLAAMTAMWFACAFIFRDLVRRYIHTMPAQIIQPRTAAAASLDGIWKAYATKSKEEIAAEFCSDWTTTTAEDWTGTYIDIFSPDYKSAERLPWDMNKDSRRHIDLRGGELQAVLLLLGERRIFVPPRGGGDEEEHCELRGRAAGGDKVLLLRVQDA